MGDERCDINLFNDNTASIYVSGKYKHTSTLDLFKCLGTQASFVG